MGGLATALALAKEGFTHIDVYEAASDLGFVGAGIQLAPNMARILDRLGVWGPIAKDATALEAASIRSMYYGVLSGWVVISVWLTTISRGPHERGACFLGYELDPAVVRLSTHGGPPSVSRWGII